MFGWLRRRLRREHVKLVYQNDTAATDTELRLYMRFNGLDPGPLDGFAIIALAQREKIESGNPLTPDEGAQALAINKDLRRLHDHNKRIGKGSFDSVYAPLGGWSFYFQRNDM